MPDDDDLVEVIITAPDEDWLVAFTRRLVERRLAACGHLTPIRSIYTWHGETHDKQESRVSLHTRASHFDTIVKATNQEHPYEVACVIGFRMVDSNQPYREWILKSTS